MPEVTSGEQAKVALETWKTAVAVQQHFNTIEMQIRSLAVTVFTATIAAAGVIHGHSRVVLFGGLVAWIAFYGMDRWWYHRLLESSVDKAEAIESFLGEIGYQNAVGLTTAISAGSPVKLFGWNIHSTTKIDLFYALVALVLVLLVVFWA